MQAFEDTPLSDVLVDDANVDEIRYVAAPVPVPDTHRVASYEWTHGTYNYMFYQTTYSSCQAPGCSFVFQFAGTRVAVYGSSDHAVSLYTLDQGDVSIYSESEPSPSGSGKDRNWHQLLYQSKEMPFGQHTLVVNITTASTAASYTLDWIEYNTTARLAGPSSSSSSTVSEPSQTSGSDGSSGRPPAHARFSTGVIAALVVGGMVAMVFIGVLILYVRRSRRGRRGEGGYDYGHVAAHDSDEPPPYEAETANYSSRAGATYPAMQPLPVTRGNRELLDIDAGTPGFPARQGSGRRAMRSMNDQTASQALTESNSAISHTDAPARGYHPPFGVSSSGTGLRLVTDEENSSYLSQSQSQAWSEKRSMAAALRESESLASRPPVDSS